MSKLGWTNLGMATLNDTQSNAKMIASLDPTVPMIEEADTGYGGPIMVTRTVAQYARAGVVALQIEGQIDKQFTYRWSFKTYQPIHQSAQWHTSLFTADSALVKRVAYLVGHPIAHSLSPLLHNTVNSSMSKNWRYSLNETGDLEGYLQKLKATPSCFAGPSQCRSKLR